MARKWMAGAEIAVGGQPSSGAGAGDGSTGGTAAQCTRDTAVFRSGVASYKFDSGAGNVTCFITGGGGLGQGVDRSWYWRIYVRVTAAPGSAARIMAGASNKIEARLRTDGKVELLLDGTVTGSPSSTAITDGNWHRIEMSGSVNGGGQFTIGDLRVDGGGVASGSTTPAAGGMDMTFGWIDAPGANTVINVDDVAAQDSLGATNNSWVGDGNIILIVPTSDNNRGAWVAGALGTTNLFDAVNNFPPVGVADASATNTSQIKNKSATNPTNCDFNLPSYTAAGVPAGATINACSLCDCDGEDPATGTKAGTLTIVSNPAAGPSLSFSFGGDAGAQASYSGGLWAWHSFVVDTPTVTLGTAVVVRITCTSGSTSARAASCCFLGMYVDYTPGVVSAPGPASSRRQRRASRYLTFR